MDQNINELLTWVIDFAKKSGASDCKASVDKRRFVEVQYREHKPEVIKEATTQGLNVDIYVNNRYAAQSTPDMRKKTLEGFILNLIETAKLLEEDPYRSLPDAGYFSAKVTQNLQLEDENYANYTSEQRHQSVKILEDACLKTGGSKVISVEAGAYDHIYEQYVKTSKGFEGSLKATEYWTGASMTARDEGDRRPAGGQWMGCRMRSDMPSEAEIGRMAAQRSLDLLGSKKIATETLPVIIENQSVARVLNGLIQGMTGWSLQQKRSFLLDKKGQAIGSKYLTFINDPLLAKGMGTCYYDGDGLPSKRREMISQGVLNDYFIDWYYSRKLQCEPTTGWPANSIIPAGSRSVEDIMKDLGRGILITGFIGGNSNSATGDFSVGINGMLFDKGQIQHPVSEMNIADNHLKFWHKLSETANDPWRFGGGRLPSLVFTDVVVSGA